MSYTIVVSINDAKKLFYVATHDNDAKNPALNRGWRTRLSKALYRYTKTLENGSDTRVFINSSFEAVLLNCPHGWRDVTYNVEMTAKEVETERQRIINEEFPEYTNCNVRMNGRGAGWGKGKSNVQWNTRFDIEKMTSKKLFAKIEWMSVGMEEKVPQRIKNAAYSEMIARPHNKTVDYNVDTNGTLYRFIRERMGLDDNIAQLVEEFHNA